MTDHYRLVLRALVFQVGIASMLASFVAVVRYHWSPGRTRPHDVVWTVIHESRKGRTRPAIDLLTSDGVGLKGALDGFDVTGPVADRFIALRWPIVMRRPGGEAHYLDAGWERSVVPLSRVAELHVGFAPPTEAVWLDRWRAWWRDRPRVFQR